jgi:hypothetical protein
MTSRILILFPVVLLGACSISKAEERPHRVSSAIQVKKVGDPCVENDGWQPAQFTGEPAPQAASSIGSTVEATPVPEDFVDYHQLKPGVSYCKKGTGGSEHPRGYFTSNCETDAHCPSGSVCSGSFCIAPCSSDADCTAPTRCGPPAGANKVRWCRFYRNPAFRVHGG